VLIGAILVAGWLLVGPLTIPRFSTDGPMVRNGVAVIVACGKKSGFERMGAAMKYAPESRTGAWGMSGGVSAQSGITTHRIRTSARRATSVRSVSIDMKTLLVVVGVLVVQVLLVWGYFAVLERDSGSVVARVFLGAALLAASLPLTLWLLVYTTVPISGD
jgi:hypothetical protein